MSKNKVNSLTTNKNLRHTHGEGKTGSGYETRASWSHGGAVQVWGSSFFCLFMLFRTGKKKLLLKKSVYSSTNSVPDANTLLGEAPPLVYFRWLTFCCFSHPRGFLEAQTWIQLIWAFIFNGPQPSISIFELDCTLNTYYLSMFLFIITVIFNAKSFLMYETMNYDILILR